jgi:hypothetical protein
VRGATGGRAEYFSQKTGRGVCGATGGCAEKQYIYLFFLRSLIHFFSLFFLSQSHVLHSSTTHEFSGGGAATDAAAPPPEKKKTLFF